MVKYIYYKILFILICFCTVKHTNAQVTDYDSSQVSIKRYNFVDIHILSDLPIGKYKEQTNDAFFGLGVNYFLQYGENSPLLLGGGMSFHLIKRKTGTYLSTVDNEWIDFDQAVWVNLFDIHASAKYFTPLYFWRIEHYIAGGMVFRQIFSGFTDSYLDGDEEINSPSLEVYDGSFGLYLGTGINIHLGRNAFLDLNAQYHNGSAVNYLSYKDETFERPIDNFVKTSSKTDAIRLALGVTLVF